MDSEGQPAGSSEQGEEEASSSSKRLRHDNLNAEDGKVQFFVKLPSGQTVVVREDVTTSVWDLKRYMLAKWTHGKSSPLCEETVFFTCEGKVLEEDQSLGEVPIEPGSTLIMRVRLKSTRCAEGAKHGAKLQHLAKEMHRGLRTDATVEEFLRTLDSYLSTHVEILSEDQVATFAGTGELQAIMSLLGSKSSFVALYGVQLLCKHLVTAHHLSILTGWHLLDALLDHCSNMARPTGALSNYVRDLFNRLCGPSATVATFLIVTSEHSSGISFAAVFAKLAKRLGALIERDATCVAQGEPLPAPEFPSLKEIVAVLDRFESAGRHPSQHEACVEALFAQLSTALEVLLEDAIDTANHREYARDIVSSIGEPLEHAFPVLRASTVQNLPAKFLDHAAGSLRALIKIAKGKPRLELDTCSLLLRHKEVVEMMLKLHSVADGFAGAEQLQSVFEVPYHGIWSAAIKEHCVREYLPIPEPAHGHQVKVRRGASTLADAFSEIEAGHNARLLSMGIIATFQDEAGVGPGVTREFFTLVSRQLFNPEFALFSASPADRTRLFPNLNSGVNPGHLSYFRFCGRFIALAIAHEMPLGGRGGAAEAPGRSRPGG